ncbi:MAG TPA: hydroxyacid dehydrogenase [Candidatus Limnocylindrales bacterium]|nr:hydroxyacid dehydrogenase [Candidatus Limnocylindrales bacterium]
MRILVAERIAREGLDRLAARHEVDERLGLDAAALRAAIEPYDALVVRSQVQVDAALLEAGRNLRVVGRAGTGLDNVDAAAAARLGIAVVNAPGGNAVAAAELTLGLLLAVARHIPAADASTRGGEWTRARFAGTELRGKVLGIVGLGRIGLAVADRAAGFGMRLLGTDPYVAAEVAERHGIEVTDLSGLVARADVVTFHVPLTAETAGLLDRSAIAGLKPGAIVLNVARGGVVDEAALAEALRDGRLGGAGIDVYEHEPPAGSPLLEAPNVVLTPHIAASTAEAQVAVGIEVADRVLEVLDGLPAGALAGG